MQPLNNPGAVDRVDGALGELSLFHSTHGFYVHGVSIESATLPAGWEGRTIPVSNPRRTKGMTGYCLESHDLAASKLFAYREKDRDFVRTLLMERLVDPATLVDRLRLLPIEREQKDRLARWVEITATDLGPGNVDDEPKREDG